MSKKPVSQPQPKQVNKPLATSKQRPRPLTDALLARVSKIIEESNGKHTRASLARDLGKPLPNISEWLIGYRSAPSSENTLELLAWANKNEKRRRTAK